MKRLAILLVSAILCVSCSIARFQPVSDTYSESVRVDTTFILDSVYIDRIRTIKEKADTIYITDVRTEYKYKYRDRVKIDTCYVDKVVTETQFVEKELTAWQKFRLKGFWYLAAMVAGFIAWKSRKLWLHL